MVQFETFIDPESQSKMAITELATGLWCEITAGGVHAGMKLGVADAAMIHAVLDEWLRRQPRKGLP